MSDVRLIIIGGAVFVGILIVWAILSSFVSVVSGLVLEEDKQNYNQLMDSFKSRFKDIFTNSSYTEVKRQYLLEQLAGELSKINQKTRKKYLGAVVKDQAKIYNIETYPGEVPNNVYLKLPTNTNKTIWCAFNDTRNRYINFDRDEEVDIDGVIGRINLVPSALPPSLDYNLDKFFHADFAVHLKDDSKMRKLDKEA